MDTALSVATEMVAELDITDQDVTRIADMIDGEIASLVPEWKPGAGAEKIPHFVNQSFCHNCVANHTSGVSLTDFLSHNQGGKNLELSQCCRHGCASMHGRFEEITFESEEYDNHVRGDAPNVSRQSDCFQYRDLWNQHESRELSPVDSDQSHSDEQFEQSDKSVLAKDKGQDVRENKFASDAGNSLQNLSGTHYLSTIQSLYCSLEDEYEKEVQQELRWLRAKYQMELRDLRDQQLSLTDKSSHTSNREHKTEDGIMPPSLTETLKGGDHGIHLKPFGNYWHRDFSCHSQIQKGHPDFDTLRPQNYEVMCSPQKGMVTAKSFYSAGSLLPDPLHRTVSLPVDAVNI